MRDHPSINPPSILRDRFALWVLVISTVARAAAASAIGPGFDEAYYRLFALHPAWGFFDHPPVVAFTAGLGYWITGIWTPLTLRLGAVLVFTAALVGFYALAGRIYGTRGARLALLLPHAAPFFAVGAGAFVIPDNGLVAAWIWALYVAWRLRERSIDRTLGFVLLGVLTGLAMLAKYHAILLPASLLIASLYDRELRRWWLDGRLYLALVVAVIVFSPCLLWNANNDWISLALQFGKSSSGGLHIRFDLLGQAIGGQLGYLTPWLVVFLWVGSLRRAKHRPEERWLLAFFLLPVVGMTLIGLTRGILPHWTMPGYIASFVLAGGAFQDARRGVRNSYLAIGVNALLVLLVILQARTGMLNLPPKADPTLDPAGWRGAIAQLEEHGELGPGDVLFANRWFSAAELAWADRDRHPVVLIGDRPHMFAWWAPEKDYEGRSGVIVTQARYGVDVEKVLLSRFATILPLHLDPVPRGFGSVEMMAWRVDDLVHPQKPPYGPLSEKTLNP